ncbi:hypothetical protein MKX78_04155 [Cytobacillus sp. FSL R5-0569]
MKTIWLHPKFGLLLNSIKKDISEEVHVYEHASTEEVLSSFNEQCVS